MTEPKAKGVDATDASHAPLPGWRESEDALAADLAEEWTSPESVEPAGP